MPTSDFGAELPLLKTEVPGPKSREQLNRLRELEAPGLTTTDDEIAIVWERTSGANVDSAPPAFLRGLREICDRNVAMLIFDEIVSGFGRTGVMRSRS